MTSPSPVHPGTRRDRRRAARSLRQQSKAQQAAAERLAAWKREADRRARFLGAARVWDLFDENQREATHLDVLEDLGTICFDAAGRMANPAMLRSGMRYFRLGLGA